MATNNYEHKELKTCYGIIDPKGLEGKLPNSQVSVETGAPHSGYSSSNANLYYKPVKPYVQGDPNFDGKIVQSNNYLPTWLWGLAFFGDENGAGQRVIEYNPHGNNAQISLTIEHEGGEDGHHGKGGRNESYTTNFNEQKATYGRSGANVSCK